MQKRSVVIYSFFFASYLNKKETMEENIKVAVEKARRQFVDDGDAMFIRNEDPDSVYYLWSSWLFKNFNRDILNKVRVNQTVVNSNGTKITRIY